MVVAGLMFALQGKETYWRPLTFLSLAVQALEAVLAVSRGLELGTSRGPSQPEFSHDSAVIAGLLGFRSCSSKQEFVENKFAIARALLW